MEILETLFSSRPRVEVLRTFLFQPQSVMTASDIADQTGVAASTARTHARDLSEIAFLKETTQEDEETGQEAVGWRLNKSSELRDPLHKIVLLHQDITPEDIAGRLQKTGDISLLILSGIFAGAEERPVDVLIAGENIDTTKLRRSLTWIEKSFGAELRYTALTKNEFNYRHNLYDKLVRDVLDYPHQVLIDDIGVTS